MGDKKAKKLKEKRLNKLVELGTNHLGKVKSKCCKKCPCFDLIKKVA